MNEYYGSNLASSDFFAHYGVKGMKWGVRKTIDKKIKEHRDKRFKKQIIRNSRSAQFPGTGGYMSVIAGAGKNSERKKVSDQWNKEWHERDIREPNRPWTDKEIKAMDNKYRKAYVNAVLKDSKIPINKTNVSRAYNILKETDETFARNYAPESKKKMSYQKLMETFDREEKKDRAMYMDLKKRPFGTTRIKRNIGRKAHEFAAQENRIHDLADEIYKRQKRGQAKLPKR